LELKQETLGHQRHLLWTVHIVFLPCRWKILCINQVLVVHACKPS
jgi:hypothetical protein